MKDNQLVLFIKSFHTVVAFFLSACLGLVVYSAVSGKIFTWTWIALVLLFLEGVIYISNGWKCPLTSYAEQKGAMKGSVSDIFLPKWLAARYFSICMVIYLISTVVIVIRFLVSAMQ